jgi:predicted tellurium resistance membrane protein TerC
MAASGTQTEERRPWVYAFIILLLVSLWMLTMRLLNSPFLAPDFELSLVYVPTVLAGIIVIQLSRKRRDATIPPA